MPGGKESHCNILESGDSFIDRPSAWWHALLIPALERQKQADLSALSSRPAVIYIVPGQPELHRDTLKNKTKQASKQTNKKQPLKKYF